MRQKLLDAGYKSIIALTGGIASGKSNIRKILGTLGAVTIDADVLGHLAYHPTGSVYEKICKEFPQVVSPTDKSIDRRKLGDLVFGDSSAAQSARSKLNSIVWPAVADMMESVFLKELDTLRASSDSHVPENGPVAVFEAALFLESDWDFVDEVWIAYVPLEEAIHRLVVSRGLDYDSALARIQSQKSNEERFELAKKKNLFTVCINTSGTFDETREIVQREWTTLLSERIPK